MGIADFRRWSNRRYGADRRWFWPIYSALLVAFFVALNIVDRLWASVSVTGFFAVLLLNDISLYRRDQERGDT